MIIKEVTKKTNAVITPSNIDFPTFLLCDLFVKSAPFKTFLPNTILPYYSEKVTKHMNLLILKILYRLYNIYINYVKYLYIKQIKRGINMQTAVAFTFINLIIILVFLVMGIYGFVLFVKLANRGIKALDIYISEKSKNNDSQ